MHKLIRSNPYSNITRYNVAELSSIAYEHALSPQNLRSDFRRTGIYPFVPSAIDSEKLLLATAHERSNEPTPTTSETSNIATAEDPSRAESLFNEHRELILQKQNIEKKEN